MKLMHNVCFQKISIPTPIEEGLLENPRGRRGMQGPKSKKESVRAMQREGERGRGKGFKFKPLNPRGRGMDNFWSNTIKTLTFISENGLG